MPYDNKIFSFKQLLNEIMYSWDFPRHDLKFNKKENYFWLNKLTIGVDWASYKMDRWELAPGVFEEVKRFYEFLKSTEAK